MKLEEAINIINRFSVNPVKQYAETPDAYVFSILESGQQMYGGGFLQVSKKDGKPGYYPGEWYEPFPYKWNPL